MTPMPARYTEAGDASVEQAIGELVDAIADRARSIPHVESLLLGGSLGRGEGTVVHDAGRDRLVSDVEVYLVGRSSSLRGAARQLGAHFAREGPEVSAAWLHSVMLRRGRAKNLSWRTSRTIRLYELATGSRVLLGTRPAIYPIDPATLPLGEGVRLVLNRLAEAAPEVARDSPECARWMDKILMACGDTLLLAEGAYTVRYRDRVTRLAEMDARWRMPDGWREAMTAAYERKLTGSTAGASRTPDAQIVLEATLATAVKRVTGEPLEPLHSFPQRFVVAGARRPELLRYLPPIGPKASYEGMVLLARSWRAGHRPLPGTLKQALLGRPLSLALQASALPLFLGIVRGDSSLVQASANALVWAGLPSADVRGATDPAQLAELLRRHWAAAT